MLSPDYIPTTKWLPTTKKEMIKHGWDSIDVIIISGDAYVDHPSFGHAVISRIIQHEGLKVAIIPQPNWQDDLRDFKKFGKPKYFFGVTSGCMDSMVNHYTANKRLRSDDAYTPGNESGFRPDYATTVYTKILKELYPETPVIIGGIEASLRRATHYDYWSDELKPSILHESGADLLVYGMGETTIKKIINLLKKDNDFSKLKSIPQTAYLQNEKIEANDNDVILNSHSDCINDKTLYSENFKMLETESNKMYASKIVQKIEDKTLIINPPENNFNSNELDKIYTLPFTRLPHPKYKKRGRIPAFDMIKFSVNIHQGCFGGCSFCSISMHQGKFIKNRSVNSIIEEIKEITRQHDFKGYLSDLGGPSANMYKMEGMKIEICKTCSRPSCIYPKICTNLNTDHRPLLSLYKKARSIEKIKKVFIGSGIRYDLFLTDKNKSFNKNYINEVIRNHTSGRLKVAPEHTSDNVLQLMRKPSFNQFKQLKTIFEKTNEKADLNQQLIPYFISAHPGCTNNDMKNLALETKKLGYKLEQVQGFTPTPMTLSTVMYYTGKNPYNGDSLYIARNARDRQNQQKEFFWYKKF